MDVEVGHTPILLELLGLLSDRCCPLREKINIFQNPTGGGGGLAGEALHLIESERYITSICQTDSYRLQRRLQVDHMDLGVRHLTSPIQLRSAPINKANNSLSARTRSSDLCFNNERGHGGKCTASN